MQVKINGTEYFRKTISATGQLNVNVLYLGGLPNHGRAARQAEGSVVRAEITAIPAHFKGVIQDVQVNLCGIFFLLSYYPSLGPVTMAWRVPWVADGGVGLEIWS